MDFQYPVSDRLDCNSGIPLLRRAVLLDFQYPVSDRLDCNLLAWRCAEARQHFQYPVSDRLDCNMGLLEMNEITLEAFSILCRIVWIVTRCWADHSYSVRCFQYPVSDRLDCNLI